MGRHEKLISRATLGDLEIGEGGRPLLSRNLKKHCELLLAEGSTPAFKGLKSQPGTPEPTQAG